MRYWYLNAVIVALSLFVAGISLGSPNDLYEFVDKVSEVVTSTSR
jgi:hypothetical protein